MMKHHGTRSLTGALFRMRRVQCALLLMTALVGSAAVMTGCKGSGSLQASTPIGRVVWEYEIIDQPGPDRGKECGSMVHNGREYRLYCDAHGRVIYAQDKVSGRWFRIIMQDDAAWLPSDHPAFEHDGTAYVFPPEPAELRLEAMENVSVLALMEEWGASVDHGGRATGGAQWSYDRATDVLDVTICIDWSIGLPNPWDFDLGYELYVVHDGAIGAMVHRAIGSRTEVLTYLESAGISLTKLEIDGFGVVPPGMAWHGHGGSVLPGVSSDF